MPQYEYYCDSCKKTFSKVLTLAEHTEDKIVCPSCGGSKVEQQYSSFFAVTSKKSA